MPPVNDPLILGMYLSGDRIELFGRAMNEPWHPAQLIHVVDRDTDSADKRVASHDLPVPDPPTIITLVIIVVAFRVAATLLRKSLECDFTGSLPR